MSVKHRNWTIPASLTACLAVTSCLGSGDFCDVVRGPLMFDPATAQAVVATDRATAEQIDAQNAYWRGNCS